MYVKDYMTTNLITIDPETTVLEAVDLMTTHNIRRLPVIDPNTKTLLGLVTQEVIDRNSPSTATSLDYHELNYLLNKTTAGDIMIKQPSVVTPLALLEEAAVLMRNDKVGALVIVEENNQVAGIITDKDIFDAFVDVLGYNTPGVRLTVQIPAQEDRSGVLDHILDVMRSQGEDVDIKQIVVFRREDHVEIVFHFVSSAVSAIEEVLNQAGYTVTSMIEKV